MTSSISRRQFLKTGVLASAGALAAPVLSGPLAHATDRSITLMAFSSTWEVALKPLTESFTKSTGITVNFVAQSNSIEGLTKLQAMRNSPTVDVWLTGQSLAVKAMSDTGLFAPLPKAEISNLGDMIAGASNDYFAASYYYPFGIVYRKDLVPGGTMVGWDDLLKPALSQKIAVPAASSYPGMLLLVLATLNGGSINNIEPGLTALKQLNPSVAMYYTSAAQTRRALASGEIWAMTGAPSDMKALRDQGIAASMICPPPSPLLFDGTMLVNGPKKDMAAQYINHVISQDWQHSISENYSMGPVNKLAKPGDLFSQVAPKSKDMVVFDPTAINLHIADWSAQFDHIIK